MFTKDVVIHPRETAWFQHADVNGTVVPLNQTDFYKKDFIGLKTLVDAGKVTFGTFDGDHLQFTTDEFNTKVIPALNK